MAISDTLLYQIVVAGLTVALAACGVLFLRKEDGVLKDPWYVPVIFIMIWVSLQHLQTVKA